MADVRILPADAWAQAVARELVDRLNRHPGLRLCLPTGETPAPFYGEVARAIVRGEATMAQTTVVLLDEYVGLAPGDPARCDVQLRHDLLDRLPERPANFHAIAVDELPPEEAAAQHDAAAAGLDLAVVGLGLNGHVGFNEPGSTADSQTRVVALTDESVAAAENYGARAVPREGITVGLDRLLAAAELWLLVTGSHKAAILRAALHGPETPAVPASYLRRHPRLVVFADEETAGDAAAA